MGVIKKFYYLLNLKMRIYAFILIFFLFIGGLLEFLSLALVIPIIQIIIDPNLLTKYSNYVPYFEDLTQLYPELLLHFIIGFTVTIYVFKNIYLVIVNWAFQKFLCNFSTNICSDLFRIYIQKNYLFFSEKNSAHFIKTLEHDAQMLNSNLGYCGHIILEIFTIALISILLFLAQPLGMLTTIIFYIIGSVIFIYLTKKKTKIWSAEREFFSKNRVKYLKQIVDSIRDIKLLDLEDLFMKDYHRENGNYFKISSKYATLQVVPRLWIEIITIFAIFFLVAILISFNQSAPSSILPVLGLYVASAFKLVPSFNKIIGSLQSLRFVKPVLNEYYYQFKNFNEKKKIQADINKIDYKISGWKNISFNDVSFSYDKKNSILKNFNFAISRGEKIGIYGESGSGKSTFLDILTGLVVADIGQINIDDLNIDKAIKSWRSNFAYLSQNTILIDDTIKNNIVLDKSKKIDNKKYLNSIKFSKLENFISKQNDKDNTIVGEKGIKLSGGQKQRIGIARAFYLDRDTLILDESTNAIDSDTEKEILNNLWKEYKYRTVILVSHNLKNLQSCDKIYEFSKFKLIKKN